MDRARPRRLPARESAAAERADPRSRAACAEAVRQRFTALGGATAMLPAQDAEWTRSHAWTRSTGLSRARHGPADASRRFLRDVG